MSKDLREIGRIRIEETKELVVSENRRLIVITEYIYTEKYKGFTSKTISLSKENIELFIKESRRVLSGELILTIIPWGISPQNELFIQRVKREKDDFKAKRIDFRQYVNSDNYKGYTKKGLRIPDNVAKKLNIFLEKEIVSSLPPKELYNRSKN